jgi:DNA-binding MarR family transcriptional regulator
LSARRTYKGASSAGWLGRPVGPLAPNWARACGGWFPVTCNAVHTGPGAPALSAASRALTATMMAKVVTCGFSDMTPALASLMPLLDATGPRATTLAQRAGITKQAISQLVGELEARGYVEQVADSTATRAKIVRLTKRGVAIRAACASVKDKLH